MKKGYLKTYIKILFFIIIITAIGFTIAYFIKDKYNDEKYETIKTDMLLIEAKTKIVVEKMNMKEENAEYIGTKLLEIKDELDIKNLEENHIINLEDKKAQYYVLDKRNLEELGLTTINLENGYYIVEYNTNEIIYTNGILDENGNILYRLSDIEKNRSEK